ncbi:hypothetical protein HYW76_02740 [Candidatus Pacearchaeota archaeon]|nr:hypothetical protein [Candidatus Pacearchaeota archaeon]
MAKVFFGCAMRGGQDVVKREELERLQESIEKLGHKLVSRHQIQVGIIEEENKLTKTCIHDRDYKWELESDVGIFEVSNPSLGVGSEISDMIHLGKPILCLFKGELKDKVSAYIQGKMNSQYIPSFFECYAYASLEDAKDKIKKFLEITSG